MTLVETLIWILIKKEEKELKGAGPTSQDAKPRV
jgi:hypothetical protein